MTRYTVVWVKSALDELAELWLNSSDRDEIKAAAHRFDLALIENPSVTGDALSEGLRSLFAPPLKAIFTVREEDRIVEVLWVRRI